MSTGRRERLVQRVKLGRGHAYIHRAARHRQQLDTGRVEKLLESRSQIVVRNLARPDQSRPPALGVVDIVRWVAEAHVGRLALEESFKARTHRRVPAQKPVSSKDPK